MKEKFVTYETYEQFSLAELELEEIVGTYEALAEDRGEVSSLLTEIKRLHDNIHYLYCLGIEKCEEVMKDFCKKVEELIAIDVIPA